MSDLYFNESDYSEENTSDNEYKLHHSSTISEKMCGNESHEKETTEAVVRRYSSRSEGLQLY